MNKFYLIVPIVLLGVFCVYYHQFSVQVAVQAAAAKAAQKAHDAQVEQEQAGHRHRKSPTIARAGKSQRDEEARQQAEHLAKFEASKQKLADETAKFQQEADSYSKEAADLQAKLDSLEATHEKLARELFDLQKQIELAKIDRRDADLEIQRAYDEVTQKVSASSLTFAPPPPTATVH